MAPAFWFSAPRTTTFKKSASIRKKMILNLNNQMVQRQNKFHKWPRSKAHSYPASLDFSFYVATKRLSNENTTSVLPQTPHSMQHALMHVEPEAACAKAVTHHISAGLPIMQITTLLAKKNATNTFIIFQCCGLMRFPVGTITKRQVFPCFFRRAKRHRHRPLG